jgi:hypothetical protein
LALPTLRRFHMTGICCSFFEGMAGLVPADVGARDKRGHDGGARNVVQARDLRLGASSQEDQLFPTDSHPADKRKST